MAKNGNNDILALRVEKLEIGFNLLVHLLSEKSAKLLYGSHTPILDRLLSQHAQGTLSAISIQRLCQQLRRVEGDREQSREIRTAASLMLIGIELKHMIPSR